MRYVMKQKLFCWGDDFRIKNEAGDDVFFVDGHRRTQVITDSVPGSAASLVQERAAG